MMLKELKSFFSRSSLKLIGCCLIAVILPIMVLYLSGILRPWELAIYDFNFWLRRTEPTDERIVIVEWDESSIQMLEETTISDDTLLALLTKISQQQPRLMGLDIYRDIPVLSPRLSDEDNIEAYNSLQKFFDSTPNLIGIEKVVEPIINPPKVLQDREQTAASDLPSDEDGKIRRAYIFPQVDEQGGPAGVPYFGVVLGYQYLAREGWDAEKLDNYALKLVNNQNSVVLEPLKTFAGISPKNQYGLDFLVNWRRGNRPFRRVSATEVIANQIAPDLFDDRLVLIGNVAASTADRHSLPLNRWERSSSPWSYGIEIPAQVASSIISSALDRRPLLKAIPQPLELALILISVGTILKIVISQHYSRSSKNLYPITFGYSLVVTVVLLLVNVIAFTKGWWIPVATAIVGIWVAYFSLNYYFYRDKERKNTTKLEMFVRDLQHSLGNPLHSITSSTNRIQISVTEIEDNLVYQDRDNQQREPWHSEMQEIADLQGIETDEISSTLHPSSSVRDLTHSRTTQENTLGQKLEIISRRAKNIEKQVRRIERYRKRTREFINFGYLNQTNIPENTNINQLVKKIVARFIAENEYTYQVAIQEDYDSQLTCAKIDRTAIEIILENLLDNAFYSVAPRDNSHEYFPIVKVQTLLKNQTIEFRVEDNGVGIPAALQPKIFQPFVSFNYSQGIGLYLTREILNLYRGKIKVESQEGRGSKFIFTLPLKI